jgi:beta-glucanase (GH16 family)
LTLSARSWIRILALGGALAAGALLAVPASAKSGGGPGKIAPPTVTGPATVGETLTATTGDWSGAQPLAFAFQWQRCRADGGKCSALANATSASYQVQATDLGRTLNVAVTASNDRGSKTAQSAPTAIVTQASTGQAPASVGPPAITGTAAVDQTLSATPGSWTGTQPIAYAYQWQRCNAVTATCAAIAGAAATSYVVTSADAGASIGLALTASNAAGTATAVAPVTAVVPSSAPPPPIAGNWQLAFQDDFDSSLDHGAWSTCFWWASPTCSITDDNELQLYNPADSYTENGRLRLRARVASLTDSSGATFGYGSGMVTTGGTAGSTPPGFAFTYGYAEARLWVPRGQGLWPAFWMLPASYDDQHEIDIMELLGSVPKVAEFHVHSAAINSGARWRGPDFSAGWHTFAIDWEPSSLTWYVDGVARWQWTGGGIPQEPMYLILNLAVGGNWPGPPDATTSFPAYLDVDYVRVWQHA